MESPSVTESDATCLTFLPKPQVIGLSFTTLAGFISTFAVLTFLAFVARNFIRNVRDPPPGGEWRLIRTHVDAYLLSLLASEILQGLGAIMDVKWVHEGAVYCSDYCTAQGAIQVIGETGVAMGTLAITLHTFFVVFFRWTPGPRSVWIYRIAIPSIWTYLTLFVVIAYTKHHMDTDSNVFFSPTPYWCWISGGFEAERIAGEYFWLWTAALSSIFFYTLLFFRLRGNIQVDPQDWTRIRIRLHPRAHGAPSFLDAPFTAACREAMAMVWYPICYTLLVLPLSIVRWRTFRAPAPGQQQNVHVETPFAVTAVVITVFGLSGAVNVVLIMLTRRNLLLFGQRRGVVRSTIQESGDSSAGRFGSGLTVSEQSRALARGQGSMHAAGGRAPTTSVGSTTLPGTSLGRSGDLLDLKSIIGAASSNWENTSTHHAPSIALRSVASLGDLSESMKHEGTPAPAPALRAAVYGNSTGKRNSLSDFELGKTTSGSSIRARRSSADEREQRGALGQPLNNIVTDDVASVGMGRRRSLGSEAHIRQVTSQRNSVFDQGERSRRLSHPLALATSVRYRSSLSSQLRLVPPPAAPPPVPPIPIGSPPRVPAPRARGMAGLSTEIQHSMETPDDQSRSPLARSVQEEGG